MKSKRMTTLAACLAIAAFLPLVAANAAPGKHDGGDEGKLLFFASDGLRQDPVAKYADKGGVSGLPRAAAAWRVRLRQRTSDPVAAEHRRRLVHARDRRVAGRARVDQQHVPRQRAGVRELDVRARLAERPAGRDARAGG